MGKWAYAKALILPIMATLVIPSVIALFVKEINISWFSEVPFIIIPPVLFGETNLLFAQLGEGTLAPWESPKNLVVSGIYRYVRNSMIWGGYYLSFLVNPYYLDSLPYSFGSFSSGR